MASRPIDDKITGPAIREAMTAASSGRMADAIRVAEGALARGGDVAALNAFLGMLHGRSGNAARAADHLKVAQQAHPQDPVIAHNLVHALLELDRKDEALAILSDDLVAADREGRLLRLRAFLFQSTDRFDEAARDYAAIVERWRDDWESWNNLGNARRAMRDFDGAIEALRRAVELAPDSQPTRFNLATILNAAGKLDEGERELRGMAADYPDDPMPYRELYAVFRELNRDDEALDAIDQAIARDPRDIPNLLAKGNMLSHMHRSEESEDAYRQVFAIEPANALANVGIASLYDLTNQTDKLAALVGEAEGRGAGPNALNFLRAMNFRRAKDFEAGLEAIQKVPNDLESARRMHIEGQLLEGVGRYDEAFAAFTRMNDLMFEEYPRANERAKSYRDVIAQRSADMNASWVARWRDETVHDTRPAPVFLYGFPRSGTTLLDTMLMGHPGIEVLEEEKTLHKAFEKFSSYDSIPDASDETIVAAREAFWAHAAERTPLKPGNILVDKNPLAINAVPIMKRLFPDAKHILALRHPCDVLLSCYVTNFRMNDGMASFARLDTGAEIYDISFRYFERVREHLDIAVHPVVYERVVEDRDRELRSLFDFLELDWHDSVLDHETTAKQRGRIKTASYAQVVEPIYKRSAGRWQNYRKHLEPVFPTLAPWVEKFGYEL